MVDPLDFANALVERGRLFNAAARADEAIDVFVRAKSVADRAGLRLEVLVPWRPRWPRPSRRSVTGNKQSR